MFDDTTLRALIVAIGIGLVSGPLGCFILWRRFVYFGDAFAHSAALGIALSLAYAISTYLGIMITAGFFAFVLIWLQKKRIFAVDALLGILAHSALATSIIIIGLLAEHGGEHNGHADEHSGHEEHADEHGGHEEHGGEHAGHGDEHSGHAMLHDVLLGDIMAVSLTELYGIFATVAFVLLVLLSLWQRLVLTTVHADLARSEGVRTDTMNILLIAALTLTVATMAQIVGILLVASMLILPAACARLLATNPLMMAITAAGVAVVSALVGIYGALQLHLPAAASVVTVLTVILVVLLALHLIRDKQGHRT